MRTVAALLLLLLAARAQSPSETLRNVQRALRSNPADDKELTRWIDPVLALADKADPKDQPKLRLAGARFVLALLRSELGGEPREPVRWEAACALARLHPSTYPRVLHSIEQELLRDREPNSHRVWEAVFQSLLALDGEAGADFLMEEVVNANTDASNWRRTRAALLALAVAPRPDARRRQAYVKRLLAQFQSLAFHVESHMDWVADQRGIQKDLKKSMTRHAEYWADLRPLVQRLLRRWTADPVTGALARDPGAGFQVANLERMKIWYGKNKTKGRSPWIDPVPERVPGRVLREFREPYRQFFLQWAAPWTVYWPWVQAWRPPPKPAAPAEKKREELRTSALAPLLREATRDMDWRVRGMAAIGLGRAGVDAAELWTLLGAESDERTREAIAFGILLRGDAASREPWQARAGDGKENPQVRAMALLALGLQKDAAFLKARTFEETELEGCRLVALGLAGATGESPRLAEIVADAACEPEIRGAAAAALSRIGKPDETPTLLRALARSRESLRNAAAAHALAGTVAQDDSQTLRQMGRYLLDPKGRFGAHRVELAFALVRIGGEEATEILRKAAECCAKDTARAAEYGSILIALGCCDKQALVPFFEEQCEHEWDASAAALGLALAGARESAPKVRERMATAERVYVTWGIEALGLLGDSFATTVVRDRVRREPRDRVVAAAAVALARLKGEEAVPDLRELWRRAADRPEYAGVAEAFGIAGPGKGPDALASILKSGSAVERAFAASALSRIAAPTSESERRLRASFFVYAAPRTLARIARFGDSFFLADTDE